MVDAAADGNADQKMATAAGRDLWNWTERAAAIGVSEYQAAQILQGLIRREYYNRESQPDISDVLAVFFDNADEYNGYHDADVADDLSL